MRFDLFQGFLVKFDDLLYSPRDSWAEKVIVECKAMADTAVVRRKLSPKAIDGNLIVVVKVLE